MFGMVYRVVFKYYKSLNLILNISVTRCLMGYYIAQALKMLPDILEELASSYLSSEI